MVHRSKEFAMWDPTANLQKIRRQSLLINSVCRQWTKRADDTDPLLWGSALVAWRIARAIGVWLHAQPDLAVHPRNSVGARLVRGLRMLGISAWHPSAAAKLHWVRQVLDRVYRDIGDLRALTSSADINGLLARHLADVRALRILASCLADGINEERQAAEAKSRIDLLSRGANHMTVFDRIAHSR
jgi:hypothetical protein